MISKDYLKKLSSLGISIIPCNDKKAPIETGWQKLPTKTSSDLDLINSSLWGIRTGYADIECVDIDLKVIHSISERNEWWLEYVNFLSDNIEDFLQKVVIAKTKNGGYHIIYKTNIKKGNTKIAALKGMKEAIIESRGVGGQFIVYDKFYTEKEYHNIDYISDEEREIIWTISKTYNFIDPIVAEVPKKSEYKKSKETDITPWDDFNNQHTCLDLIGNDFSIVKNTNKSYVIKRYGAESPHSGYIFKDSGCMFLFSTGTQYPAEKLLSAFSMYAYDKHFGDFNKAAGELYKQGYGTRQIKSITVPPIVIEKEKQIEKINFPIEIFPKEIQHFILESSNSLGMSIDYMGCSFMWMLSLIVGNSLVVEVKPGWKEVASLWIAVVGKPGIGKTPSLMQMIAPLRALNVKEQKEYQKKMEKYIEYEQKDKKEKEKSEEIKKPKNKQFIVGDITIEALVDLHEENPNSVGVFKDELAGWIKDMNKYRAGSDLEFWLSSWSGASISLNRKTSKSAFVDKPFIPVLGGIQPAIFEQFSSGDNKENGFIDRVLISYPELSVNKYNNNFISAEALLWYNDFVVKMKETVNRFFLKFDENDEILPTVVKFNEECTKEWIRIHDKITDLQNSDSENEYMKSMLPKQKSYIPRFALLINTLWSFIDEKYKYSLIHSESMVKAEKLSEYFINMAKLVKQESTTKNEFRKVAKDKLTLFDKVKAIYEADPDFNRAKVAEMFEVSRQSIYKCLKTIENATA